jgi:hypothetical protein
LVARTSGAERHVENGAESDGAKGAHFLECITKLFIVAASPPSVRRHLIWRKDDYENNNANIAIIGCFIIPSFKSY